MAATANRNVERFIEQELRTFRIKGSTRIFRGTFVGLTAAGFARPLVAGDAFVGLSYEEGDNSAGSDGAKKLRVYTISDIEHAVSPVRSKLTWAVRSSPRRMTR